MSATTASSALNDKFTFNFGNALPLFFDGRSEIVKIYGEYIYILNYYYQDLSHLHPSLTFTAGKTNGFLMKTDIVGKIIWVNKFVSGQLELKQLCIYNKFDNNTNTYNEYSGIYIMGNYINSTSINDNSLKLTASPTSKSGFLVKYDFDGNLVFIRKITSTNQAIIISIDVNNYGIFTTIGRYSNLVVDVFDTINLTNVSVFSLSALSTSTFQSSAVLALNSSGAPLANYTIINNANISYTTTINNIKIYNKYIYIIGRNNTTNTSQFTGIPVGTRYQFIRKYTIEGILLWNKNIIGSPVNDNIANHLSVNDEGIYIVGIYNNSILSPPELSSFLIDSSSTQDAIGFFIKYSHDGLIQFAKRYNNPSNTMQGIFNTVYSDNFGIYLLGTCFSYNNSDANLIEYGKDFMTSISSSKVVLEMNANTTPLFLLRYSYDGQLISSNIVADTPNLDYGYSINIGGGNIGIIYTTNIDMTGQSQVQPQSYFTLYGDTTLGTTIPPNDLMLIHNKQLIDSGYAGFENSYPYYLSKTRFALSRTE
jgi:hypothetical protein